MSSAESGENGKDADHERTAAINKATSAATFKVDGDTYLIVADRPQEAEPTTDASDESKPGSLRILRRSSNKSSHSADKQGNPISKMTTVERKPSESSVELSLETLPAPDALDSADIAARRLRKILRHLETSEVDSKVLQTHLNFAIKVLEISYLRNKLKAAEEEEDDEFSEVEPDSVPPEVRAWLTSTFTRGQSGSRKGAGDDVSGKPKFRSVANAIRAGIFVERICRRPSASAFLNYPHSVTKQLKRVDDWDFDVFALHVASDGNPLKYLGYELFTRYGILNKYKISSGTLIAFLNGMEVGYGKHNNPYHNSSHAADVTQTVHYLLFQCGLMNWLSDLEIFATLLAAMIHDYEHTGTTNNFHVMSTSPIALLYNDRAVLENHHASAAFKLCHDDDNCNILKNLTREEYREFRTLVIEMVLATDMSFHFQQVKQMRSAITLPDCRLEKSKVLSLALHSCDISHPSKPWNLHHIWTLRLMEEFFRQGDLEHQMGLPYSPLCDRNTTHVADAQLSFIDFIVEPTMNLLGDVLMKLLTPATTDGTTVPASDGGMSTSSPSPAPSIASSASHQAIPETSELSSTTKVDESNNVDRLKPWKNPLVDNRVEWKNEGIKETERKRQESLAREGNKDQKKSEE